MLFDFHISEFSNFLSILISNLIPLWSVNVLCMISILSNFRDFYRIYHVVYPGECFMCTEMMCVQFETNFYIVKW